MAAFGVCNGERRRVVVYHFVFRLQRYALFPNPQNKIRRRWITFREDNSTLTLGRDRRYHFVFTLPEKQLAQLPDRLVHQALTIAQKVDKMIAGRVGKKGSKK